MLLGDARKAALTGLIDYAGLFPPAALDMAAAAAGYRDARQGRASWLAGRFLCPSSRLDELAAVLTKTMTAGEAPWPVGVVFDEELGMAASHAASFHAYTDPAASVQTAELRIEPGDGTDGVVRRVTAAGSIDPEVAIFLEVPMTDRWETEVPDMIGWVADARARTRRTVGAKLRCGGLDATAFPSPEQVAMFIIAAEGRGLPFKATAGLHEPLRHHDDELGVMRHGFLNLLAAAAVAGEGAVFHDVAGAVAETDPTAFSLDAGAFRYRHHRVPTRAVGAVRAVGFVAYGSCDFEEPVAGLEAMGIL